MGANSNQNAVGDDGFEFPADVSRALSFALSGGSDQGVNGDASPFVELGCVAVERGGLDGQSRAEAGAGGDG